MGILERFRSGKLKEERVDKDRDTERKYDVYDKREEPERIEKRPEVNVERKQAREKVEREKTYADIEKREQLERHKPIYTEVEREARIEEKKSLEDKYKIMKEEREKKQKAKVETLEKKHTELQKKYAESRAKEEEKKRIKQLKGESRHYSYVLSGGRYKQISTEGLSIRPSPFARPRIVGRIVKDKATVKGRRRRYAGKVHREKYILYDAKGKYWKTLHLSALEVDKMRKHLKKVNPKIKLIKETRVKRTSKSKKETTFNPKKEVTSKSKDFKFEDKKKE